MDYFVYEGTKQMISVVKAEPLDDYRLRVHFTNGAVKIYDVKPLLEKRVYAALKNEAFFATVGISCGSVAWSDDVDICPESLYWEGIPAMP